MDSEVKYVQTTIHQNLKLATKLFYSFKRTILINMILLSQSSLQLFFHLMFPFSVIIIVVVLGLCKIFIVSISLFFVPRNSHLEMYI